MSVEMWAMTLFSLRGCCKNAIFGRGQTPTMNLTNKPLNVMFLHCPHLQLHPFIPSYGRWLPGNDRYILQHRESNSTPPHTLPAPLVEMNNKLKTYIVVQRILLLAERPCLPFSPGVLCSHCLTEWLIWVNFTLQTSQVHSLSRFRRSSLVQACAMYRCWFPLWKMQGVKKCLS